jgi:hypothetical protein
VSAVAPEAEARQLLHDLLYAIAIGDAAVLEPMWCDDATMIFQFGQPQGLIAGRPAVVDRFRRLFAGLAARLPGGAPYVRFKIEEFVFLPLDPRHAVVCATLAVDGRVGRRTLILRREPQAYRILHLHASNLSEARGPDAA